jgi:hypothetical protein
LLPRRGAATRQNREHCSSLERRRALDNRDVGHPRGDAPDLIARDFGMRRLATAEAYLDFDFVALLEESARRAHAHLQVMIVGTRSQPHFFDL